MNNVNADVANYIKSEFKTALQSNNMRQLLQGILKISDTGLRNGVINFFLDNNIPIFRDTNVIPSGMFYFMDKTTITLPNNIKTIMPDAFEESNIKSVILNEGLENINRCAFENSSIESLKIPSTIKHIDARAFLKMPQLKTVYIPDEMTVLQSNWFDLDNIDLKILVNSRTNAGPEHKLKVTPNDVSFFKQHLMVNGEYTGGNNEE